MKYNPGDVVLVVNNTTGGHHVGEVCIVVRHEAWSDLIIEPHPDFPSKRRGIMWHPPSDVELYDPHLQIPMFEEVT